MPWSIFQDAISNAPEESRAFIAFIVGIVVGIFLAMLVTKNERSVMETYRMKCKDLEAENGCLREDNDSLSAANEELDEKVRETADNNARLRAENEMLLIQVRNWSTFAEGDESADYTDAALLTFAKDPSQDA